MKTTTIKLKYLPSTTDNHEGTLYYQITHNGKVRRLISDYRITDAEWDNRKSTVTCGADAIRAHQLAGIRRRIRSDIARINSVVDGLESEGVPYEADDIITEYQSMIKERMFFGFMENVIARLKQTGKTRTGQAYRAALGSYRKFRDGKDILFDDITSDEMELYESSMLKRNISPNTTSFYMRILRATYNRAVEKGLIEQRYPFRHVYTGVAKTVKRAIGLDDIKRIKRLKLDRRSMQLARDIFLFGFYTRGMSFIDIAYLRKTDLKEEVISYRRRKTGQLLNIKIEKCMQEIIDRYSDSASDYVFPIIKAADGDVNRQYRQYRSAMNRINARLKEIGGLLDLPVTLTTYVSRHSWGSIAKFSNIPISVISESMGHDSENTTRIYLASFEAPVIDRANAKILKRL